MVIAIIAAIISLIMHTTTFVRIKPGIVIPITGLASSDALVRRLAFKSGKANCQR
jgi:intracellular septation protein A